MSHPSSVPRPCHRHFVALPLLCTALLCAWGWMGSGTLSATLVLATDTTPTVRTLGGSVAGGRATHDVDGTLHLTDDGLTVVRAEGLVTLTLPGATVTVADGIAAIDRQTEATTILAFSGPVEVAIDGARALVPAGMQWTWTGTPLPTLDEGLQSWWDARRPTDIPATEAMRMLAITGANLPSAEVPEAGSLVPEVDTPFVLRAARVRADERAAAARVSQIDDALAAGDEGRVADLLADPTFPTLLQTRTAQARLPFLLSESAAMPSLGATMAAAIAATPDGWLHLSFLPGATWLGSLPQAPADATPETLLLKQLLFPLSDRRPQALPQRFLDDWSAERQALLPLLDQPDVFQAILSDELSTIAQEAQAKGWVERAERYQNFMKKP